MKIVMISLLASAGALRLAVPNGLDTVELKQGTQKFDFDELKAALGQMEPYVFIRDYGGLHNFNHGGSHSPDVPTKVLLGEDSPPVRAYKRGDFAEKPASFSHPFNGKMLNTVKYKFQGGHSVDIGFSRVGDDYYDPHWAADMLERRRKNSDGLWVLGNEDRFYELLYHSIVQWPGHPEKAHTHELAHAASKIGVKYNGANNNQHMKSTLNKFMKKHNYTSTNPFHKTYKANLKWRRPFGNMSSGEIQEASPGLGNVSNKACKTTHFIAIGKTGGSTVKGWMHQAYPGKSKTVKTENMKNRVQYAEPIKKYTIGEGELQIHGHDFKLGDGDPQDCYAFFVRDPVDRWVSGYMSRYRGATHDKKGKQLNRGWAPEEAEAFQAFPTPEALAQALGSHDAGRHADALKANAATIHTRLTISHYLPHIDKYIDRIVLVGEINTLATDFTRMIQASGLPQGQPIEEEEKVNQNPHKLEYMKKLTPKAHQKLKHFLKKDYAILDKLAKHGLLTSNYDEEAAPDAPGHKQSAFWVRHEDADSEEEV